ncbi:hypothetical protein PAERUG_E15_London_28_01_14_07913 [Pseudomonas aeruginosa]|nr:hypothetical protein PAERUG_E15_London_28_01_14_07913 [Pseudomonas aeruginosa]
MNAYDIAREERIETLHGLVMAAHRAGDTEEKRRVYGELKAAILARSPEQVAVLEQRLMARVMEADHA